MADFCYAFRFRMKLSLLHLHLHKEREREKSNSCASEVINKICFSKNITGELRNFLSSVPLYCLSLPIMWTIMRSSMFSEINSIRSSMPILWSPPSMTKLKREKEGNAFVLAAAEAVEKLS